MSNESIAANSFGFFGKLPQFPDFIKYRAGAEEFILFDDWLQKGISSAKLKLGSDWKDLYSNSNNIEFVFPIKRYNKIISGVLFPSMDKSGRQYPFIIFSILQNKIISPHQASSLPLVFNSFFYRVKQLFNITSKSADLNQILSEFNKAEFRLNPVLAAETIFNEYLDSTSLNEFINRISIENLNYHSIEQTEYNSFNISFGTDEDNYNFDTGFIIYLSSRLYGQSTTLAYIFKSITDNSKVKLSMYFNQPEPTEYVNMIINSNTTKDVFKPLMDIDNSNISLREFLNKFQS
ncbi:MAG: type VI secretion system-associated protein TagF [Ignavibacteriaceae bacterium]